MAVVALPVLVGISWLGIDALNGSGGQVLGITAAPTHALTGKLSVLSLSEGCGLSGASATTKMDRMFKALDGATYPCPDGPGGGYSDLRDGTAVTVSDGEGDLLGVGSLTDGLQTGSGVTFDFQVDELPERPFYVLEISDRGELPYSLDDLADRGWSIGVSLDS